MDSRLPFALGEDRLRLLYRLPLSGKEESILVLSADPADDPSIGWSDQRVESGTVTQLLGTRERPAKRFDALALPGTLTSSACGPSAASARDVASLAYALLKPGGVLVGHLDNVLAPRNLKRWLTGKHPWHRVRACRGFETASCCIASLHAIGFRTAECFYVEPHIGDPMALVSSEPGSARVHFVRTVRRNSPLYSRAGYLLRASLAQARLGGLLQSHLFFWARKPC